MNVIGLVDRGLSSTTFIVLVAVLVMGADQSHASTAFTYVGNPFVPTNPGCNPVFKECFNKPGNVTATVIYNSARDFEFTISGPDGTLSSSVRENPLNNFTVVNGVVQSWNLLAATGTSFGPGYFSVSTTGLAVAFLGCKITPTFMIRQLDFCL